MKPIRPLAQAVLAATLCLLLLALLAGELALVLWLVMARSWSWLQEVLSGAGLQC